MRASLWVVVSGFVLQGILMGAGVETVAVFVKSIVSAQVWSSSTVSAGVSIAALAAALATPIVGVTVDRWGVRVPILIGMVCFALGYPIIVTMQAPWEWMLGQMLLGFGFAFSAILPVIVMVTISVRERTALALGIVTAGASVGAFLFAPAVQLIVDTFGWRGAYAAVGALVLLTPIPLLLFTLPRGRLAPAGTAAAPPEMRPRLDLRRELGRPGVLPLAIVMIIPALVIFGVHVHLVRYLTSIGHGDTLAATALGTTIGISALGKLAGGYLGDRIGALRAFRFALALETLALCALAVSQSILLLGVFVVAHGLAVGTRIAVIPVIARDILGSERFGTLFGMLQFAATLGAAVAPLLPALIADATESYAWAVAFWAGFIALALLIALSMHAATTEAEGALVERPPTPVRRS